MPIFGNDIFSFKGSDFGGLINSAKNTIGNIVSTAEGLVTQGSGPPPEGSINTKVLNSNGPDPIQGYDVGVWFTDMGRTHSKVLLAQFTSILITFKNSTEPYMPIGSRIPIYFDGEMQIAFSLEKGLVDMQVFQETTGFRTISALNRYIRSPRFQISFEVDSVDWSVLGQQTKQYGQIIQRYPSGRLVLSGAKIDEFKIGAVAGKSVVATQWMGVAETIDSHIVTMDDLTVNQREFYNTVSGIPLDPDEIVTAGYSSRAVDGSPDAFAQMANTKAPPGPSVLNFSLNALNHQALLAEYQALQGLSFLPAVQTKLKQIQQQLASTSPD